MTKVNDRRRRAGVQLCAGCDATAPKRIEKIVMPLILAKVPHPPSALDDALFGGAECGMEQRSRPDVLWASEDICVVLEIDENSHLDRTSECEARRVSELTEALHRLVGCKTPVHFVRFNPDAYDRARVGLDARVDAVAERIDELLTEADHHADNSTQPHIPRVEFFYYHSNAVATHVKYLRERPGSVRVSNH